MTPDWMDDAACKSHDPNIFFPGRGEPADRALSFCARCPVTEQCLTYALDLGIVGGVWGGMAERQRRKLRAGRPRPKTCRWCDGTFYAHGTFWYCSDECRKQGGLARARERDQRKAG